MTYQSRSCKSRPWQSQRRRGQQPEHWGSRERPWKPRLEGKKSALIGAPSSDLCNWHRGRKIRTADKGGSESAGDGGLDGYAAGRGDDGSLEKHGIVVAGRDDGEDWDCRGVVEGFVKMG